MKKTLLAAALVTSFAGIAQAETAVTLYGLVDTGVCANTVEVRDFRRVKHKISRIGPVAGAQSGSRWGLKGTEELGSGLRAEFVLEGGFNSGNGDSAQTNRAFGRQATIGLANDTWGRVDIGRQTNIAGKYFNNIDPFKGGFEQSSMGMSIGTANVRYDNMVMYQTPSFNGVDIGVGYSFSVDTKSAKSERITVNNAFSAEEAANWRTNENDRAFTTGIRYSNGPVTAAASFDCINGSKRRVERDAYFDVSPRSYAIGGSYDFEVAKVSVAYAKTLDGWIGALNVDGYKDLIGLSRLITEYADGFRSTSYVLGVSAPLSDSDNVFGSWQRVSVNAKPKGARLTGDNDAMNVYSVGYTHNLSKRTNLYAYGSYASDYAFLYSAKSKVVGFGVRHSF
ncbi:porin [Candidatus Kinetoplastibacterium desouzaii TCC079E]|uniref:Porin n=1 Tax=Candidatus Kinetoplastidibacterium desouzai TCC079E TaxID=1208919 RepID=M1L2S4_9PROT|nr:porin [Candidatus Kinetoplastibacterium desouzaii]AGF47053.1 porin [Candidatus Kinetoplastibacterium desouzaii TCC079E]